MYVFCGLLHPSDKARTCDSGFLEIFIFFREFLWGGFDILTQKCRKSIIYENLIVFKVISACGLCIVFNYFSIRRKLRVYTLPSNHFVECSKPGSQRKFTLKSVTKVKMRNITPEWICLCWLMWTYFHNILSRKNQLPVSGWLSYYTSRQSTCPLSSDKIWPSSEL